MIKNLKIKLYYFVYIKNVFTFQDIIKNIKSELECFQMHKLERDHELIKVFANYLVLNILLYNGLSS